MSENLNSDAIALRREARRRRILENAESRLKTITGKYSLSSCDEPKSDNIFHSQHNDFYSENTFDDINPEISRERNILKESFQCNPDEEVKIETPIPLKKSYLKLIIQKKLHYIILPLIIHILLLFELGFMFYNNIFCPFITVKLAEYIFIQVSVDSPRPNIFSLVPSLSKGHIITCILKTYSIATNLFSEFFLYMFIFILSEKLFSTINELFITR